MFDRVQRRAHYEFRAGLQSIPVLGRALNAWRRRGAELHDVALRTQALTEQLSHLEEMLNDVRHAALRGGEYTSLMAAKLQTLRRTSSYAAAYRDTPLVTVRIGAYNPGDLLFDRALRSVVEQTYPAWEAIVVTDGPDQDVAERIDALGDSRIVCLQRSRQGPYPEDRVARYRVAGTHPFNEAISHARGAWIAPIDHDDEWDRDHLEILMEAVLRSRAELVYGRCRVQVGELGQTFFGQWPPVDGQFGFQGALYHAGIAEFMLYDVTSHITGEVADWNLARRMLDAGVRFEFVDRPIATYYVAPTALTFESWKMRLAEQGDHPPDPR